jgi:hypothetical protein
VSDNRHHAHRSNDPFGRDSEYHSSFVPLPLPPSPAALNKTPTQHLSLFETGHLSEIERADTYLTEAESKIFNKDPHKLVGASVTGTHPYARSAAPVNFVWPELRQTQSIHKILNFSIIPNILIL